MLSVVAGRFPKTPGEPLNPPGKLPVEQWTELAGRGGPLAALLAYCCRCQTVDDGIGRRVGNFRGNFRRVRTTNGVDSVVAWNFVVPCVVFLVLGTTITQIREREVRQIQKQ